jgi:integrase
MIYAGRTPNEVARQLGHADPGMTLRVYGHVFDDPAGKRIPVDQAIANARSSVRKESSA